MSAATAARCCVTVNSGDHSRPIPPPIFSPHSSIPSSSMAVASRRLAAAALVVGGAGLALAAPPLAYDLTSDAPAIIALQEPGNALSLPTWAIHVSSVVEWITAMVLVWEYGEKSGFQAWKGLSWGMVPLLGGALCACTWHFFYNSESLEILVAIQAALTVIGNMTMAAAAFRIFKASEQGSEDA